MSLKNVIDSFGVSGIEKFTMALYDYVDKNPKENFPKLISIVQKLSSKNNSVGQKYFDGAANIIKDDKSTWHKYIMSFWTDIDNDVRRVFFKNFFINAVLKWSKVHGDNEKKYGCNIPWAILLDPTSACNLHCTGCWAAEYGNRLNLTYDEINAIINQANELGCYFFLMSGGEPLVRKDDIIRICKAHPDCLFSAFTNGTLIDEKFTDDMLKVKNFVPAISVEGFEEDTDFRRGNGTYKKVINAMNLLKSKKLPFGISCCYTSKNCNIIGSEKYFDKMIEWGAKFCWLFTYMPVGNAAVRELMVSAGQRKFMYEKVREYRRTKPLFTLDFWNDGEYSGGCIAGGRRYLHINANGDYEPCAFVHYSDSNIREKTLLEALKSPLFIQYRQNQPFNTNHLRPCPVLDNPHMIRRMVYSSGAHSTDMQSPENVDALASKCLEKSYKWGVTADEIWGDKYKIKENPLT